MAPGETGAALIRRLLAEIAADRRALADRTAEVRRFSAPVPAPPAERPAVLESILERVARTLEGGAPVGEDWHRALLRNAALEIERVRPPILGNSALAAADDLRRFRHFLRHAYAASLDAARIARVAASWTSAFQAVEADLDAFSDFLRRLAESLERSG
jgi:chorismate mutase